MGVPLSKAAKPLEYTCYELAHTWSPSCSAASTEIGLNIFEEALKIYGSVYAVSRFAEHFIVFG